MKVLAICGSPRKGNTEAMLRRLLDGVKEKGANIELVLLKDKKIEFCDGCLKCEEIKSCCKDDEMQSLYGKLLEADLIVFGSPTYFDSITGLLKNFIDRTNPVFGRLKGKKMAIVCCGQAGKESIQGAVDFLKNFAEIEEMQVIGILTAEARNPDEIKKDEKTMSECFGLGKKIVE